jgi:hypothetical protein
MEIQFNWIARFLWSSSRARPKRHSTIGKTGAILEKLQEAHWLTLTHVRAECDAHRNLTEINVFDAEVSFDYGSTSIVETL